jgi:UDP-2,3-diacylglucosamine pyrophosphatase LpxH
MNSCCAQLGRIRCGPIFVVSDLHIGVGGPRDNFAYGGREKQFYQFLDYVDREDGVLIIAGDLLELWQNNVSEVIVKARGLFDTLSRMGAVYVLGNHDADLLYFASSKWLLHCFFDSMCQSMRLNIAGKRILIVHGHQADPYCASSVPGIGRITAIYSGLKEDRHGGPMLNKYRTVENRAIGWMDWLVDVWHKVTGKPDRYRLMNHALLEMAPDVIISGHTHRPGHIGTRLYNTGTWAETTNSFVRVDVDGTIQVFDWVDGKPVPNFTELSE